MAKGKVTAKASEKSAKTKAIANAAEKKLRRNLQEAETAAIEARQELESAQGRVVKAMTRLEKRQTALEQALAALEAAVSPPATTSATSQPAGLPDTAALSPEPHTNGTTMLVTIVTEAPAVDQIGAADAPPSRPQRGRKAAAATTSEAASEPALAETAPAETDTAETDTLAEPDAPLGIIVP